MIEIELFCTGCGLPYMAIQHQDGDRRATASEKPKTADSIPAYAGHCGLCVSNSGKTAATRALAAALDDARSAESAAQDAAYTIRAAIDELQSELTPTGAPA